MLEERFSTPETPLAVQSPPRRWERIATELREDIAAGRFAPGAQLPNEDRLAARFGVHRHTLRHAIRSLVWEGHLRVVQGRGTYVRSLVLDYVLQRRTRLTQNLADAGERARRDLLAHQRAEAKEWAPALRVAARTHVEILHTRAVVRGRPIGLSTTAYPSERFRGIADAFRATRSITGALAMLGVSDYRRVSSTISSRLPSDDEADALSRPPTNPVMVVQFVNVDATGTPVEAGRTLFAADAVQLSVSHA